MGSKSETFAQEQKMDLPDSSPSKTQKVTGRAFYESIGSPRMVLAPMVDQSEFVCLSFSDNPTCRTNIKVPGMANTHALLHAT